MPGAMPPAPGTNASSGDGNPMSFPIPDRRFNASGPDTT